MEQNNPQHKFFLWHLDIEPFTWKTCYGEQCPSFVTEEKKEVWRRYLVKLIKKHLKAEVMNTPEFRNIEIQIREEKAVAHQMGRAAETVYGEATVSRQDGATEEKRQEVCRYIKETAGQYPNHRGMKKKLMDLMPETPFEGEPMAVTREPNNMEKSLL